MYTHHADFSALSRALADAHDAVTEQTPLRQMSQDWLPNGGRDLPSPDALDHISDEALLDLLLSLDTASAHGTGSAQHLIQVFGDLGHVLSARPVHLRDTGGLTAAQILVLKLFSLSSQRLARAKLLARPVLSSSGTLLDYCHATLGHRDTEQFRVLFLDRKNALIADAVMGEGTVDHVPVYPREVLRRALELNACALILVHNHPSGDPTPSEADIAMTRAIQQAAQALSITVHDHVIIGKSREVSLRAEGVLSA